MKTEFEFIQHIRDRYGLSRISDDCAVMPKDNSFDSLLTADLLIEDIDFQLEWTEPEFLGHKALAVSLSDIAAMASTPRWGMLSLAVSEKLWKTDFLDRFYAGWFKLAEKYDVELIGGDISRSPDKLVIDSIAGGECPRGKALLRSGAKPGDLIFVSGTLGASSGGLTLLQNGVRLGPETDESSRKLLLKQLKPLPQVIAANMLQLNMLGSSLIDLSDGLSSDLSHICMQSGVGAMIHAEGLPIDPNLAATFPRDCLAMALHGGEEYELLLTADPADRSQLEAAGFTYIGEITDSFGDIQLTREGKPESLSPQGFRHF